MGAAFGPAPAEIRHLSGEARLLHDRLHRVIVALALTEDLLGDFFEHMAMQGGARSTQQRLEAKRARAAADECRAFAARLSQLGGTTELPVADTADTGAVEVAP